MNKNREKERKGCLPNILGLCWGLEKRLLPGNEGTKQLERKHPYWQRKSAYKWAAGMVWTERVDSEFEKEERGMVMKEENNNPGYYVQQ